VPVDAPPDNPSAADLIERDRVNGKLDDATALLYRVYAQFGDSRLPEPYASAPVTEDRSGLSNAQRRIDRLPAAVADEVRPFFVRPTDPSSVFYDVRVAASAGTSSAAALAAYRPPPAVSQPPAAPAPVTCNRITGWGYATGVARFKVWGECGTPADDADIQILAATVEELWDAEATYLSRQPLPDEGKPDPDEWLNDQGGDSRIDIYLVNACLTRGGRCRAVTLPTLAVSINSPPHTQVKGVGVMSAYVLIPKGAMQGDQLELRAYVAHELFHVFQNAMNVDGTDDPNGEWHWFVEASAKWAEWAFVPGAAPKTVAPWFASFERSPYPLSSTQGNNEYASFSWPLFMEQEAGHDAVARAWQAIEGKPDLEGVTRAIDGVLKFHDRFHDFAVRTWNAALGAGKPLEPLLPRPPTGPPQPGGPHRHPDETLLPSPPGDLIHTFSEGIPGLDASYVDLKVDDNVGQLVLDFTGLFPPAAQDRDALVKVKDKGWEYRKLTAGPTTWCMDNPDDDIEELIVIVSNHEWDATTIEGEWTIQSPLEPCLSYQIHIEWTDSYNGVDDEFVFDGWADTIDPNLSTPEAIVLTGTGVLSGQRPGWAGCNPGLGFTPSGIGEAEFVATITGDQVTIGGYEGLDSTFFGVGTEPFTLSRKGGTKVIDGASPGSDLCTHLWHGKLTATVKIKPPP
jgi:hypothetical protein